MATHPMVETGDKILMVDDDPRALAGYVRTLGKHFSIETASVADEGLKMINQLGPFAVVVSDLKMPGMNGMEFLARVHEDCSDTVGVLLTGCLELVDKLKLANDAHISQFLIKPCSAEDLKDALRAGIAQHRQATAHKKVAASSAEAGDAIQKLLTVARGISGQVRQIESLEARTVSGELALLALLRELLSPAAAFGKPVPISYRRANYKTPIESEHWTYLPEGFPLDEGAGHLLALQAVDHAASEELHSKKEGGGCEQYICDCLYLLKDRKWLLVERFGTHATQVGSNCGFDAQCKIVTDRSLIGRFSISAIAEGLLASTNELTESLGSRAHQLKRRASVADEYADKLRGLIRR